MKLSSALATVLVTLLALAAGVGAPADRSLSVTDSESGVPAALEALLAENRKLKEEASEAKLRAANSDAEAEVFRRQIAELKLRMEALGVSTSDPAKLEQRLLQAVHDLQLAAKSRKLLADHMVVLAEAASSFMKEQSKKSQKTLELALKKADELLVEAIVGKQSLQPQETASTLFNGKVSAISDEYGCVVINLGRKQGVKVGMPFQVRRGDLLIGTLRVVDIRQTFSGAVVQNLKHEKDRIKLGDSVRVETQFK